MSIYNRKNEKSIIFKCNSYFPPLEREEKFIFNEALIKSIFSIKQFSTTIYLLEYKCKEDYFVIINIFFLLILIIKKLLLKKVLHLYIKRNETTHRHLT